MSNLSKIGVGEPLDNMAQRKKDHIDLAFESKLNRSSIDNRFYYEPLLSAHPKACQWNNLFIGKKQLKVPVWVSSMTGGTAWARTINYNLARACQDFGMGMGLGSCRPILYDNEYLKDFAVRSYIGDEQPLYANLGIAQVEELYEKQQFEVLHDLIKKLEADGLIIHVNPLQEWLQPEGDRFKYAPIHVIKEVLNKFEFPVIVKEVGQGMGYESIKALLQLPLAALDFAANGGTNFAKLELLRSEPSQYEVFKNLINVGHSAEDMTDLTNQIVDEIGEKLACNQIIISGGIQSFLDGYYLIEKSKLPAIYGQASAFLKHARGEYQELFEFIQSQLDGLALAKAYLTVRE